MKFWAKVRFKGEKNVEYLIRSFFQEFNSESSIVIKGDEAKVEIVFNEPPMKIIEAINHCDIIEFNYGKSLGEYKEDEIKQEVAKKEILEETRQVAEKKNNPKKAKISSKSDDEILELNELAEKSSSYKEFVKSVVNWLEMGKRKKFFLSMVSSAEKAKKITWNNIEVILKNNGVSYSGYDKIWCAKQVSSKFNNSKTITKLIKEIVDYKTYDFNQETEKEEIAEEASDQIKPAEVEEETFDQTEQTVKEEEASEQIEASNVEAAEPKNRVKMECMPEIPHFEEILGSVDKTQPVEERVKYVLTAMGLNKMSVKEQNDILEIANIAVRLERISFNIIFLKVKIPMEETMPARMAFSKFINDFVNEYYSDKKVKLLDFLKDLQSIVMFDNEIDFTD